MDLIDIVYPLFRQKYSALLDDIESAIFVFVEELILAKNIPLQDTIDYNNPTCQHNLQELLESISFGLSSINISDNVVSSLLEKKFSSFGPESGNNTYIDWIANSFQPQIQKVIFQEIIQFLIDAPSAIPELVDFSLLSPKHIADLNKIKADEAKIQDTFQWIHKLSAIYSKKIQSNEEDYNSMIQFKDYEKNLQSYYFSYRILEFLNLNVAIDKNALATFLTSNIQLWAEQNANISEKYPMTLYCGTYLANALNINLNKEVVKSQLKKHLVQLVNTLQCPIYENPFLTYYVIKSCTLLNLKLTQKLILGLIRQTDVVVNADYLKNATLLKLATIFKIHEELDSLNSIPEKIHAKVRELLISRQKSNLYYNHELDFMATGEGIFAAVYLSRMEGEIERFPLLENTEYIAKNIFENLPMFDFGLTSQLSALFHSIRYYKELTDISPDILNSGLTTLLFDSNENPFASNSSPVAIPTPEPDLNFVPSPSSNPSMNSPDYSTMNSPDYSTMNSKIIIEPTQSFADKSVREVYVPKRALPSRFWDFFGDFPILIPDIVGELNISMEGIAKIREDVFESLEILHQWVVCLKILNIEFPIPKETLLEKTERFRVDFGFTDGDSDMPDPKNTFYGLSIYSEFEVLNRINLYNINQYLTLEAQHFNAQLVLTNDYIFMGLRILARENVPMGDFMYLLPQIFAIDIHAQNDRWDGLIDLVHHINLIKAIDPNYDMSIYRDTFLTEVQIAQEDDGSINRKISETAKVLITLYELGLQGVAEAKFIIKNLQYDVTYFGDVVKQEPIGWEADSLGFLVELNISYWSLMALSLIYPSVPPMHKAVLCPQCSKFFARRPKFCNQCGFRF